MTDTMMIRDCIRSQGMKLGHVAHVLGITNNTLRCKLENESEFKGVRPKNSRRCWG